VLSGTSVIVIITVLSGFAGSAFGALLFSFFP
jgi:hypothetical protein